MPFIFIQAKERDTEHEFLPLEDEKQRNPVREPIQAESMQTKADPNPREFNVSSLFVSLVFSVLWGNAERSTGILPVVWEKRNNTGMMPVLLSALLKP